MKKNKRLTIKDIPELDRPYEKYVKYGAHCLSDSELLAILIKTGTKDLNCLELSKQLLSKHDSGMEGFDYLINASCDELMQYSGIGKVKAIQIKALVELARRMAMNTKISTKITCPKDVYNALCLDMEKLDKEEIRIINLDVKNIIKSVVTVVKGNANSSSVSIKELLSEPIKQLAHGIILVHNHPSGDSTPSRQDILLTKKVLEYASMFDIELKDHVIIGKGEYTSLREKDASIFMRGKLK